MVPLLRRCFAAAAALVVFLGVVTLSTPADARVRSAKGHFSAGRSSCDADLPGTSVGTVKITRRRNKITVKSVLVGLNANTRYDIKVYEAPDNNDPFSDCLTQQIPGAIYTDPSGNGNGTFSMTLIDGHDKYVMVDPASTSTDNDSPFLHIP